jgi:hypothetical protein
MYKTAVTMQVITKTIRAATRKRGLARRASNVLDGSKKTPVSVSAVDISGPVGADVVGVANDSLMVSSSGTMDG